jgi:hypothetical protein
MTQSSDIFWTDLLQCEMNLPGEAPHNRKKRMMRRSWPARQMLDGLPGRPSVLLQVASQPAYFYAICQRAGS